MSQLGLIAIAALWGANYVVIKVAITHLPVLSFLAYRYLIAAAVAAVVFRRDLRGLSRSDWRAGLGLGTWLTVGSVLQTFGLARTSAADAGFITGMFVVLTPLLGAVLLGQRAGRLAWSGALVSAVGLALLAGVGSSWRPVGDALVLGCAIAFAAHILLTDRAVSEHRVGALLVVQLGVSGLASLTGAVSFGTLALPRGATVWAAVLTSAVLASALAFWVQACAQRHAPPARTALILASEPAFAGLFGVALEGDRLTPTGWLGAALILCAILVVELGPRVTLRRRSGRPASSGLMPADAPPVARARAHAALGSEPHRGHPRVRPRWGKARSACENARTGRARGPGDALRASPDRR